MNSHISMETKSNSKIFNHNKISRDEYRPFINDVTYEESIKKTKKYIESLKNTNIHIKYSER